MSNELNDIRSALEHQLALYGDLVIVPSNESGVGTSESGHSNSAQHVEPNSAQSAAQHPDLNPASSQPALPSPKRPETESPAIVTQTSSPATPDVYQRIETLIPEDSPLRSMDNLDDVRTWVAATELIELDRTRINPVFGVGNPNADLMVIGEAPGADEDKKGEPFVGRAGQLLTKILEAIGFERDSVYIANILKSRPPDNRPPKPDEVKAHLPILHKQIALIQPKLILCVGRTSGTSLLGKDSSLKDMRGTFHDYHGIELMVTYHPAALLRNPNWKRPTWDDVQQLRTRYDELTA